jgi:hypothetical protein
MDGSAATVNASRNSLWDFGAKIGMDANKIIACCWVGVAWNAWR